MEPVIKIYNKYNAGEYDLLLKEYNFDLDVYYNSGFLEVDAHMQKGEFEIFSVKKNEHLFIYPYIKLSLIKFGFAEYYDLTSPYGYCGPYCSDAHLFDISEQLFVEYAKQNKYATEFVRYHFLYSSTLKFSKNIQNVQNRSMLVLNLQKNWDDIWKNEMSVGNRNITRKLEKEGYRVETYNDTFYLQEFIEMYNATMKHSNAEDFYYFENDFYYNLFDKLKEKIVLVRVCKGDVTYCSALFFKCGNIFTYYLSARNLNYKNIPASNLLLTNMAKLGNEKGYHYFNMGGGRTNTVDDSLFKFKNNFCKEITLFYIGKRAHLPEIYKELKNNFIIENGLEKYEKISNILQFYRV